MQEKRLKLGERKDITSGSLIGCWALPAAAAAMDNGSFCVTFDSFSLPTSPFILSFLRNKTASSCYYCCVQFNSLKCFSCTPSVVLKSFVFFSSLNQCQAFSGSREQFKRYSTSVREQQPHHETVDHVAMCLDSATASVLLLRKMTQIPKQPIKLIIYFLWVTVGLNPSNPALSPAQSKNNQETKSSVICFLHKYDYILRIIGQFQEKCLIPNEKDQCHRVATCYTQMNRCFSTIYIIYQQNQQRKRMVHCLEMVLGFSLGNSKYKIYSSFEMHIKPTHVGDILRSP